MAAKKILMLVGDYVEDYEAMVPLQMLLMVGHQVDVVCPGKRPGDTVRTAVHDFEGDQTYSEKRGHNFAVTADFDAVVPATYDALVIPGGRRPSTCGWTIACWRWCGTSPKCANRSPRSATASRSSPPPACWQGRRCTAYPAVKPDLVRAGAAWVEVNATFSNAVVDGNLVTAAAWPGHPAVDAGVPRPFWARGSKRERRGGRKREIREGVRPQISAHNA